MEFVKRTVAPAKNNTNYYGKKNSMVKYGYTLPNCTTYVHGRWAELGLDESKLCLGDAKKYYNYKDGFKRSSMPKVGAIGCYDGGQYGHVLSVEEIYTDGTMLISESNYVTKEIFKTRKIGIKDNVFGYKLQGFILPPVEFTTSTGSYIVKVTCDALNVRTGPGTNYPIAKHKNHCIRDKGKYTIVETKGNWGKLKSGAGWICLDYTSKV